MFGVQHAYSASEHLAPASTAKSRVAHRLHHSDAQSVKGSHLTVPSFIIFEEATNLPGAQLSSHIFPHLFQTLILKQHPPPSLPPSDSSHTNSTANLFHLAVIKYYRSARSHLQR